MGKRDFINFKCDARATGVPITLVDALAEAGYDVSSIQGVNAGFLYGLNNGRIGVGRDETTFKAADWYMPYTIDELLDHFKFELIDKTKKLYVEGLGENTPVIIFTTEAQGKYPFIGQIGSSAVVYMWDEYGRCSNGDRSFDLVEAKEKFKKEFYVNIYRTENGELDCGRMWESARDADDVCADRFARVKVVIEAEEGQMDE